MDELLVWGCVGLIILACEWRKGLGRWQSIHRDRGESTKKKLGIIETTDPVTGVVDRIAVIICGEASGDCGANAELIKASPEMYEALALVNEWAHTLVDPGTAPAESILMFVENVWPTVDNALAKADREYVA